VKRFVKTEGSKLDVTDCVLSTTEDENSKSVMQESSLNMGSLLEGNETILSTDYVGGKNSRGKRRTSIMDQGTVYNQRRMQREAVRMATCDHKTNITP
jgi:hypothetical protein